MPWLVATPLRAVLFIAALLAVTLVVYALVEARYVRITSDELISERLPPEEFDGAKLVFLADIHAGRFLGKKGMRKLVKKVNAEDPDVIVLGGDYVGGRANGARTFYGTASGFCARIGKVAVLGNHDVWEGADEARAGLEAAGFTLLENASQRLEYLESHITIAGVDDLYTGEPDVAAASHAIPADEFAVLVSHNPDVFATQLESSPRTWDLALAGHTHAGQLTALGYGALFIPSKYGHRYRTGWMREQDTPILVTKGVGAVTLPLRFFAEPEVHVITLKCS